MDLGNSEDLDDKIGSYKPRRNQEERISKVNKDRQRPLCV